MYSIHENGYAEINKLLTDEESISVPSDIDGYPVAYIGKEAFVDSEVKNVVLPDGILAIGEYAFSELKSLETINFPETLLTISSHAFYYCENLKVVSSFPDSLQAIGDNAFNSCKSLTNFNSPADLIHIGHLAFASAGLTGKIEFYNQIYSIAASSFKDTEINEVILSNGIYSVGPGVFAACSKLKKAVMPKTVGDSENGFGWGMFMGCFSLEEVNIPENIIGIPSNMFQNCTSLKSIRIPASIDTLLTDVFAGCISLKDIYFDSKDCSFYYTSFLFTPGLTVHAPKGGSIERFFKARPLVRFEETD